MVKFCLFEPTVDRRKQTHQPQNGVFVVALGHFGFKSRQNFFDWHISVDNLIFELKALVEVDTGLTVANFDRNIHMIFNELLAPLHV